MLDHADYMPSFVLITEARRHDVTAARKIRLVAGSIVAMDRVYNDYTLFARFWPMPNGWRFGPCQMVGNGPRTASFSSPE